VCESRLLKTLAGRYNFHHDSNLTGDVLYNGLKFHESKEAGLRINRVAAYISQTDNHLATLTVRETIEFILRNAVADISLLGDAADAELIELHKKKTDLLIKLLDMESCKNTIAGNDLLRGISGGRFTNWNGMNRVV